jgi:hypothetical protein
MSILRAQNGPGLEPTDRILHNNTVLRQLRQVMTMSGKKRKERGSQKK